MFYRLMSVFEDETRSNEKAVGLFCCALCTNDNTYILASPSEEILNRQFKKSETNQPCEILVAPSTMITWERY